MFGKVFRHFVAPRTKLAAAKLAASIDGQVAFQVQGQNMEPSLLKGAVCRYRALAPEEQLVRGNIVAFTRPEFDGHVVPSRVLALAQDTIEINNGELFVNDQKVAEPYVRSEFALGEYSTQLPKQTVPLESYFLLGDYRDASQDSRYFGAVSKAEILGLVVERA